MYRISEFVAIYQKQREKLTCSLKRHAQLNSPEDVTLLLIRQLAVVSESELLLAEDLLCFGSKTIEGDLFIQIVFLSISRQRSASHSASRRSGLRTIPNPPSRNLTRGRVSQLLDQRTRVLQKSLTFESQYIFAFRRDNSRLA